MKTTDIYGEVPEKVHNAVVSALDEIDSRQIKVRRKIKFSTGVLIAAVIGVMTTITVAAVGLYFNKTNALNDGKLTYEFNVDYELKPGEFEVTPNYLPEGYKEQKHDSNKYSADENYGHGISVFVYNTSSLDIWDKKSSEHRVEKVEETVLSGMEAHVITLSETEKYEYHTNILLFNPTEGYVLWVCGDYSVPYDELIKVADNLTVTKVGEDEFETPEEKEQRENNETSEYEEQLKVHQEITELMKNGFPEEALIPQGEEFVIRGRGYTVNEYEFFEDGRILDKDGFMDYDGFLTCMNSDGTLKPYLRQRYEMGEIAEEEMAEQVLLRVNLTAKCYEADEIPLDATIQYTKRAENGALTWDTEEYRRPSEYWCEHDNSCIWINSPNNTIGGKQHFWTELEAGETVTYDIVFIVDKDRTNDILLNINGANNLNNGVEGLDGYLMLG